jgi:predicted DNA-binding transcriptional regulator AlpA
MSSIPTPGSSAILPELLSTRQAAQLCGLGERTLWRYSRSGIAPRPVKIGNGKQGAVRFRRAELLAWIEAGCPRVDGRAAQ